MKVRNTAGRLLATLGASATVALGLVSCVPRADDINLVQPGYVRKAIFQTEDDWYYRRTIVKSETTNSYAVEGMGDWSIERIRFEIQENVLIAYKPYESIPGSGTQEFEGNTFFKGPVVAAWPIVSHFDIQRGYDTLTNRTTNVIDENTMDLPWYDRKYMRVNFANNLIAQGTINADRSAIWFPIQVISSGGFWTNLDTRPTDQFASRFSDDYVELNESVMLGMDIFSCAAFAGFNFSGFGQCGFGEAKVRHSFLRVDEPSDFVPRYYPDAVVKKDAQGNTVYDPDTGEVVRENIYSRFGIFRLQLPTFDRGYGYTESGRLWRARIYNLWERHTDDNGNILPFADRTPKPMIWYLNAEYPMRWREAATRTAVEYNRVYSSMVADLMGTSVDQIPAMFEIRDNDCNEENIINFVSNEPDLFYAIERSACASGEACGVTLENMGEYIGVGNLKKICTSLEAATIDPDTGVARFNWQRIGDVRYNMLVYFNNPQQSGWGGLGPSNADSRTGEVISGSSYIRGHYYEIAAATVNDYIELMNDEISVTDIVYGQQIRRHIAATLERRANESRRGVTGALADRLDDRIASLGATREDKLQELRNPDHLKHRMEKIKGTRLEERLVSDQDLAMAGYGVWRPGDEVTEELWDRATPWGRATQQDPFSAVKDRSRLALSEAGFCFLQADFDPHWAGLATALQNQSREQRYEFIATRLLAHVMLHEVGHNVGLAHNFEGSFDATNYDEVFWNNTCLDGLDQPDCTEENVAAIYEELRKQNSVDEFKQTTVMEYLSSGKGLFGDVLGKYDEAAIRFAYAEQVEVFSSPAVQAPGGDAMREWRYLNDYRDLPNYLCGGECANSVEAREVLSSREWVAFDPQNPPNNEVPYLFCDNYYNRMTPFCATNDYGASLNEIFMNYKSMWQDYFFFNNFIRDRLVPISWDPGRASLPTAYIFNFNDVVAQYFYIMTVNAQSDPSDPFTGSFLRNDMATVLGQTLNFATEVMATPEPERNCLAADDPPIYLPSGFFGGQCDEYAPIDSEYAIVRDAIQPALGDARPASLRFTEDYEDFDWAYVGSFFDKNDVLRYLGWSRPRLFRFNYELDRRNYYISTYRLFEPELREFYDRVTNFNDFFIAQLLQVSEDLGSFWCRRADTPELAYRGYFEPRRMIDLDTLEMFPGPSEECEQAGFMYPTILANIPFNAMFFAHSLLSSDFDSQVDMGKELKVYVRGADDDFVDWATFPNCETAAPNTDCFCSTTDLLTGLEYRAIQKGTEEISMACRLIQSAQEAQDSYEGSESNPFIKDYWRGQVERLEYARDLYRTYHNR